MIDFYGLIVVELNKNTQKLEHMSLGEYNKRVKSDYACGLMDKDKLVVGVFDSFEEYDIFMTDQEKSLLNLKRVTAMNGFVIQL